MKYWKCPRCSRHHTTDDNIIICPCSECLTKMIEVDHGEERTDN